MLLIKGGNYYVFTFIEGKSYQKKDNIFDNEIAIQNPILYSFPDDFHSLKLKFDIKTSYSNKYEIKFITEPLICSELKPCYNLLREDKGKVIKDEKNEKGIFFIERKYMRDNYSLIITDYRNRKITFPNFTFVSK